MHHQQDHGGLEANLPYGARPFIHEERLTSLSPDFSPINRERVKALASQLPKRGSHNRLNGSKQSPTCGMPGLRIQPQMCFNMAGPGMTEQQEHFQVGLPQTHVTGVEEHQRVLPTYENISESDSSEYNIENILSKKEFEQFKKDRVDYANLADHFLLREYVLNNSGAASMLFKFRRRQPEDKPAEGNRQGSSPNCKQSTRMGRNFDLRKSSLLDKRVGIEVVHMTDDFVRLIPQAQQPAQNAPNGQPGRDKPLTDLDGQVRKEKSRAPLNSHIKMQLSFEKYIQLQKKNASILLDSDPLTPSPKVSPQIFKQSQAEPGPITVSPADMDEDSVSSAQASSIQQLFAGDNSTSKSPEEAGLDFCFNRSQQPCKHDLSRGEQEVMERKIFRPFFISNNTIMEYQQKQGSDLKLSIHDILENNFFCNTPAVSRLYFQVISENEEKRSDNSVDDSSQPDEIPTNKTLLAGLPNFAAPISIASGGMMRDYQIDTDSDQIEIPTKEEFKSDLTTADRRFGVSPVRTGSKSPGTSWVGRASISRPGPSEVKYFEFEIRRLDDFKLLEGQQKQASLLVIRDVTVLVKSQQKFSDQVYQNAIENSYSHEQMTPLNCIMINSSLAKQRLLYLFAESQESIGLTYNHFQSSQLFGHSNPFEEMVLQNFHEAKEAVQLLKSIEQASKSMWFYTMCQLQRMKLKQNKLRLSLKPNSDIMKSILKVLWPFDHQIQKRGINITIHKKIKFDFSIVTDWKLYQLIIFNVIQNAVKYNKQAEGDIAILLNCEPIDRSASNTCCPGKTHLFKTEIIDSGMGINKDVQHKLFVPFQDLKSSGLTLGNTSNQNIGLGLTCSSDFTQKLDGTIKLKHSQKGLTIFKIVLPVTITEQSDSGRNQANSQSDQASSSISVNSSCFNEENEDGTYRFMTRERSLPVEMKMYFMKNQVNLKSPHPDRQWSFKVKTDKDIVRLSHQITFQQSDTMYARGMSRRDSGYFTRMSVAHCNEKGMPITYRSQAARDDSILEVQSIVCEGKSQSQQFKKNWFASDSEGERFSSPDAGRQGEYSLKDPSKINLDLPQGLSASLGKRILSQRLDDYLLNNFASNEEEAATANELFFMPQQQSPAKPKQKSSLVNPRAKQRQTSCFISQIEEAKEESEEVDLAQKTPEQAEKAHHPSSKMQILRASPKKIHNSFQNLEILKAAKGDNGKLKKELPDSQFKLNGLQKRITSGLYPSVINIAPEGKRSNIPEDGEMSSFCDKSYSNLLKSQMSKGHSDQWELEGSNKIDLRSRPKGGQFACINLLQDEDDSSIDKSNDDLSSDSLTSSQESSPSLEKQSDQIISRQCVVGTGSDNGDLIKANMRLNLPTVSEKDSQMTKSKRPSMVTNSDISDFGKKKSNRSHRSQRTGKSNSTSTRENRARILLQAQVQNQSQKVVIEKRISVKKPESSCTRPFEDQYSSGLTPQFDSKGTNKNSFDFRGRSSKESVSNSSYLPLPSQGLSQFRKMTQLCRDKATSSIEDHSSCNISKMQSSLSSFQRGYHPSSKDSNPLSQYLDSVRQGGSIESKSAFYEQFRFGNCELEEESQSASEGDLKTLGMRSCTAHMAPHIQIQKELANLNKKEDKQGPACDCRPRILIVDDTEFNILSVSTLIQKNFDIEPEEAVNGQIAVDMYQKGLSKPCQCPNRAYRLIIMDIQMPVMDGFQASEKILDLMKNQQTHQIKAKSSMCLTKVLEDQAKPPRPPEQDSIPPMTCIVASTAYTSDDSIKKCLAIGMKKVLPKPVSAKQINEVMQLYFYRLTKEEYKLQSSLAKKQYRSSLYQSSNSRSSQFKNGSTSSIKLHKKSFKRSDSNSGIQEGDNTE